MSDDFNPDAFRAQLDQGGTALRDLAVTIGAFWTALCANGMPASAATAVVCQWIASVMLQQGKPQ